MSYEYANLKLDRIWNSYKGLNLKYMLLYIFHWNESFIFVHISLDTQVGEININYGSNHFKVEDDGEDVPTPSAPPAHHPGEERFEDAIGESMKICPVCSESFSADIDQANFDAHILSHVQKICPICHNLIEEVDDNGFQFHVNQHLDKDQEFQE